MYLCALFAPFERHVQTVDVWCVWCFQGPLGKCVLAQLGGLTSRGELNGRYVIIEHYNPSSKRYKARLQNHDKLQTQLNAAPSNSTPQGGGKKGKGTESAKSVSVCVFPFSSHEIKPDNIITAGECEHCRGRHTHAHT